MHFSPVLELYQWEMAIGGQRSAVSYELSVINSLLRGKCACGLVE